MNTNGQTPDGRGHSFYTILQLAALALALAPAPRLFAQPGTNPPATTARDVTFLLTSDVHYDAFENEDRNDRVRDTLKYMNAITNLAWPDQLGGGPVQLPRGVLVLGDVIDDGDRIFQGKHQSPRQWAAFIADFGLDGKDGLLNFPVYEGWGNHDGPPAGREKFGFSFQAHLKERNRLRQQKGWLTELSANGMHYSWDWDRVHFVQLGIYIADESHPTTKKYSPEWHHPQGALTFLKHDLAKHIGSSGRPVVLMSHCGFDNEWWPTNAWKAAYEAAKPYNVILYLYGHTGTGLKTWAPDSESQPWQCVNTGQTENGFFIVQIIGDKVRLAFRTKHWLQEKGPDGKAKRTWDGTWEWKHLLEKPVAKFSSPSGPERKAPAPHGATLEPSPGTKTTEIVLLNPPDRDFYSKQLTCEGIPIKAHQDVSDAALFQARERLSMMLSNLPAVSANLRRAGAELHIIGKDQVTSDLPEHRHLKGKPFDGDKTVDQRTRGLGGRLTSCGEENLLRLEKDRYRGRDICVHEFGHNIYQHGVPAAVRARFKEQYQRSLARELWKGSYAGSNHDEFFAELSMWYFGTHGDLNMTGAKPENGPAGLKQYDPEAFALMEELYSGRMEIPKLEEAGKRTRDVGKADSPAE